MRTLARSIGDAAEDHVAASLVAAGWILLARNVRAGRGELDLVAVDPGPPRELVVVEVRWRGRRDFGLPEETFGQLKRARLMRALGVLLDRGCLPDGSRLPRLPVRVDLIVVEPPATSGGAVRTRHHRAALGRS